MDLNKKYVKRWMRWWRWKKKSVSYWWSQQKRTVFRFFNRSRGTWPHDTGDSSVVRESPSLRELRDRDDSSKFPGLSQITLSSLTETGQAESSIPVLKQRSYIGKGAIPSALANASCADLGVDGVLENLNTTLGTSYTLDSVISVLSSYVEQNLDFGTAYAYLRGYWNDTSTIEHVLRTQEEEDMDMRRNVLVDGRIINPRVPPRRVWDLYANRVVPYWVVSRRPLGISHAWMSDEERTDVMTPINGYEWPVPIPKDANLDLIRIELLNLGAQYMWLDVLCLRQKYSVRDDHREEDLRKERLRVEEWKLDVPTIGYVYNDYGIYDQVCYFSGLGRPLNFKPGDFESDRCWFNRAWTLQELNVNPNIAGETSDGIMAEDMRVMFYRKLDSVMFMHLLNTIFNILSQMQKRVSTNPLDKVTGLAYLLRVESIPIYDGEQSEEDAWANLVDAMRCTCRAELLFYYPEPGNRIKCWRPSWEQVMKKSLDFSLEIVNLGDVYRMEEKDVDWFDGLRIESVYVCGLADSKNKEELRREFVVNDTTGVSHTFPIGGYSTLDGSYTRRGKLVVKDDTEASHTFQIAADHGYSIPDGSYTLLGSAGLRFFCAIGRLRQDGKFEKLSVFSLDDPNVWRLMDLGVIKHGVKTILC
ncbi:hypothetical protein EV421DRAFT_2089861 [Armillaria borealis]|uniref:Heterokaryon incompatibility domain-containing protein n=1 Tax=Armillaria borealis TaxID=47425 RepID=A0AA39MFM9_9AGAR|nr:hypothetical protein EV421DRAFT_2089861 [Armillaria borealis]